MKPGHILAAALALATSLSPRASAQLGLSESNCAQQYGAPASILESSDGTRQLIFSNGTESVSLSILNGVAQRVSVEGLGMDSERARVYLAANASGCQWADGTPAGQSPGPGAVREWLRSDDSAMAVLAGHRLTITAAAWNTRPPPAPVAPAVRPETAGPARAPRATLPLGCWLPEQPRTEAVALVVSGDGVATWQRRSPEGRWRAVESWWIAPDGALFVLSMPDGTPVAVCERLGGEQLRITLDPQAGARAPTLAAGDPDVPTLFRRVNELPRWKPPAPRTLPPPGADRARVLQTLGAPRGSFRGARGEILVYPWGQVVLTNGHVQVIE